MILIYKLKGLISVQPDLDEVSPEFTENPHRRKTMKGNLEQNNVIVNLLYSISHNFLICREKNIINHFLDLFKMFKLNVCMFFNLLELIDDASTLK